MITISNLHKRFNTGKVDEVYALRGVDLHVRQGEFVTVIGTNGSGKSTLLNAVAGSFLPDEGRIEIAGVNLTRAHDWQRARLISRVFQNPFMGTAAAMTIAENLHMAGLRGSRVLPRRGLDRHHLEGLREQVRQLEMGLEDRLDALIGTLSGGQRQALTLLMAVLKTPKVLLLDEHTAALDPKSATQVIALTRLFVERHGLTTMMVTHSMQQALDLGDRTIVMHKGRIIEDIPTAEKRRLAVDDLLGTFAELRKSEQLTDELHLALRREYV
jgi:putative tryptophan/tyrosine transport system ATP-binding protein